MESDKSWGGFGSFDVQCSPFAFGDSRMCSALCWAGRFDEKFA